MAITQYGIRSATAQPMRIKITIKGKRKERQTQNVIPPTPRKTSVKNNYLNVLLIAIVYIQSMTIIYHLYSAWQSHYTVPITIDVVLYKYCIVLYNKLELVAI